MPDAARRGFIAPNTPSGYARAFITRPRLPHFQSR
jgi:hypothetical protein